MVYRYIYVKVTLQITDFTYNWLYLQMYANIYSLLKKFTDCNFNTRFQYLSK